MKMLASMLLVAFFGISCASHKCCSKSYSEKKCCSEKKDCKGDTCHVKKKKTKKTETAQ